MGHGMAVLENESFADPLQLSKHYRKRINRWNHFGIKLIKINKQNQGTGTNDSPYFSTVSTVNIIMHFCERQHNISRTSCCQFVQLVNDTGRIPLCDSQAENLAAKTSSPPIQTFNTLSPKENLLPLFLSSTVTVHNITANLFNETSPLHLPSYKPQTSNSAKTIQSKNHFVPSSSTLFPLSPKQTNKGLSTPEYLKVPSDVPEDHVTFLFGIFLLISVAVLCTMFIMRLTKPKFSPFPLTVRRGGRSILDYDLMLWMPSINCNSGYNSRSANRRCHRSKCHRDLGCIISQPNRARSGANTNPPIIAPEGRQKIQRRTPILVLLRAVASCRGVSNDHTGQHFLSISHNSLSTVSTNSTNLTSIALPSYGQAMTPSSSFTLSTGTSGPAPPPYDELQCLNQ